MIKSSVQNLEKYQSNKIIKNVKEGVVNFTYKGNLIYQVSTVKFKGVISPNIEKLNLGFYLLIYFCIYLYLCCASMIQTPFCLNVRTKYSIRKP